jgi:hypothetical protein
LLSRRRRSNVIIIGETSTAPSSQRLNDVLDQVDQTKLDELTLRKIANSNDAGGGDQKRHELYLKTMCDAALKFHTTNAIYV